MTKLSLKEILNIPELAFYMEPQEFSNFVLKSKDYEILANVYNASKMDIINDPDYMPSSLEEASTMNSDSKVTKFFAEKMRETLLSNEKKVNKDSLLLFLGGLASKYLEESYKNTDKILEIVYSSGDILWVTDGNAIFKSRNNDKINSKELIKSLRESLAIGILKVSREFQSELKNGKNISVSGVYMGRGGSAKPEKYRFSLQELDKMRKSSYVFQSLSVNKTKELVEQRLLSQSDILKAIISKNISKEDAILLIKDGVLRKEDVLRKVFKVNDYKDILKSKDESDELKIFLYAIGEVEIKELEKSVDSSNIQVSNNFYKKILEYFDSKKIGEFITHNVLNYIKSKKFLKILEDEKKITSEQSKYFEKIMEDFRCDELLNHVETESIEGKQMEDVVRTSREPRLTIDPTLRLEYLKSIGTVKRVKINGEMAISENEKNRRKTNSLDGYELLIIPDKKIAVLEKFYEVTRDKEGHMVYKRNKKGEVIPAIENATYILPIGLAKDLVESKNKKDLIASPYVHRTFHTMDWVRSTEARMMEINPEIEFEEKNTEKWKEKIAEDYKRKKDKREIEI